MSPPFLVEFAHVRSASPSLDFLCFQNKRGLVVGISVALIPATVVVVPGVYTNEVLQYLSQSLSSGSRSCACLGVSCGCRRSGVYALGELHTSALLCVGDNSWPG